MVVNNEDIRSTTSAWIHDLDLEAQAKAERLGPLHGPVTLAQRPLSIVLDVLEAARQAVAAW